MSLRHLCFRLFRITRSRLLLAILAASFLGFFLYNRYFSTEALLARQWIFFDDDATALASPNLNEVRFWFDNGFKKLPGPSLWGDALFVGRPYHTNDGRLEFVVQSAVYRDRFVHISLIAPPQGDVAFHVADVDTRHLKVHYPQQGLQGAP